MASAAVMSATEPVMPEASVTVGGSVSAALPTAMPAAMPTTVLSGAPIVYAAPSAASYITSPIPMAAPAVFGSGQVTYLAAAPMAMDAGQVAYLGAPATMEGGQVVMQAPYLTAPTAIEGSQVVMQAPHLSMPLTAEGQMMHNQVQAGEEVGQVSEGAESGQVAFLTAQAPAEAELTAQTADYTVQGMEGGQVMYAVPQVSTVTYAAPALGAPTRVTVPPEIFSKLAMGGTLTPEEVARFSGQSVPEQTGTPETCTEATIPAPGNVTAGEHTEAAGAPDQATPPADAKPSEKKKSSSKKDSSKKAMKASKKKEKGCC